MKKVYRQRVHAQSQQNFSLNFWKNVCDCTKLFLGDSTYTLFEKAACFRSSKIFNPTVQERTSINLL